MSQAFFNHSKAKQITHRFVEWCNISVCSLKKRCICKNCRSTSAYLFYRHRQVLFSFIDGGTPGGFRRNFDNLLLLVNSLQSVEISPDLGVLALFHYLIPSALLSDSIACIQNTVK